MTFIKAGIFINNSNWIVHYFPILFLLILLPPSISVITRRFCDLAEPIHKDANPSEYSFPLEIPIFLIWLFVVYVMKISIDFDRFMWITIMSLLAFLLLKKGTVGANRFGEDPLQKKAC